MVSQEQTTQTEQYRNRYREYSFLIGRYMLKFLSSLILPLMLGIFTVVITFQQQKLAREQRLEDLQSARQQRLEDRNESELQRQQAWKLAQNAQDAQSKAIKDQYQ